LALLSRTILVICLKTTFQRDVLVPLEIDGPVPLHVQLERQLRTAVQAGRLGANVRLPATRVLAGDLGISRGVVVAAYEQLTAEGYFVAHRGSGTSVAQLRHAIPKAPVDEEAAFTPRFNFQPGVPDLTAFPRTAWLSSFRRALREMPAAMLGYPDHRGPAVTRRALASYLARSRATIGDAEQIVLCAGFTQALELIAQLFRARDIRRVAIENPGFGNLRRAFTRLGIATELVPVDEHGLRIERVLESKAEGIVVTPAHHYPTGASLATSRRIALLEWAERRNALIVEDDYDSELRFDRPPLGALQGLAPGRVIYVGTASKSLCPGLRLGWLLSPRDLSSELALLKRQNDGGAPTLEALAFGEFVRNGAFERHIRTMRSLFRMRHTTLTAALRKHLPALHVSGIPAGMHVLLSLPAGCDEAAIMADARKASINVLGTQQYWMTPGKRSPALVLGYGQLDEALVAEAVAQLAKVIARYCIAGA
jgi:GntR family transcriptional regulator/MocR family aminotransferase